MQPTTLRIIYMGTPEFAVPSLERLVENGFHVVAVVTAPDKPSGRGLKLTESPVKQAALKLQIPVLQPTNLKSPEFLQQLKSFEANLQIVVAFRMLPEAVWNMPTIGTFNLHASLLPQYRGAAPINWAIMNGEKETGVTTFFLQHEIDTGDILLQQKEPIHPDDTVGTLYERLMEKGASLVLETVKQVEKGGYETFPQLLPAEFKKAPKIFKETCEIDFNRPSAEVYNFVRGLSPYPTAWTRLNGKICKIYGLQIINAFPPDKISTDGKTFLRFKTANGAVEVTDLQLEGKKRMPIQDFLRGFKLEA